MPAPVVAALVILTAVSFSFAAEPLVPRVQAVPLPGDVTSFRLDDRELVALHHDPRAMRPFWYPLRSSHEPSLTRIQEPVSAVTVTGARGAELRTLLARGVRPSGRGGTHRRERRDEPLHIVGRVGSMHREADASGVVHHANAFPLEAGVQPRRIGGAEGHDARHA